MSVPDSDRYVAYAPVVSTTTFPVPFTVYGDPDDSSLLEVKHDGEIVDPDDYTFSGTTDHTVSPAQTTAGNVVFAVGLTGDVTIEGDRAPDRLSVFTEGVGVSARAHNAVLDAITATQREIWQKVRRLLRIDVPDHEDRIEALENTAIAGGAFVAASEAEMHAGTSAVKGVTPLGFAQGIEGYDVPNARLAAPARTASVQELLNGGCQFARYVDPGDEGGTTDVGAGLEDYFEEAKTLIEEPLFDDSFRVVLMDCEIPPGTWRTDRMLPYYSGLSIGGRYGAGYATRIKYGGGAGDNVPIFKLTKTADGESAIGVNLHDMWLQGAGSGIPELTGVNLGATDTVAGVLADTSPFGLIFVCGLERLHVSGCYDGIRLVDSFTARLIDNYCVANGRNNLRIENGTGTELRGGRYEYAGEDGVYVSAPDVGSETMAMNLYGPKSQHNYHRNWYFVDVGNVNGQFYSEDGNTLGGFPSVEFADGPETLGDTHDINLLALPGDGGTGQSALKIARCGMLKAHVFIRGNGFATGVEMGANVTDAAITGKIFGPATFWSTANPAARISTNFSGLGPRLY